ncbi:hypothetical protein F4780DRAFT_719940 [Xylariomycetidae sp. FL0641]|nr:hypothetical protein F4780DRAFT_719940 [Xylariomycetidae sp. FL0641]
MPSPDVLPRYWLGHDLIALLIHPVIRLASGQTDPATAVGDVLDFVRHLATWKEGTYETWDPLPFLVLYHVYWPLRLLFAWRKGQRWSRVNVSTTKMFAC